ncbi:MAG: hypothetical protein DLM68_18760 [Hyphomicrobiales bacterium]|nr:MAG: hypothetical protein DLM68_18760 [Hyphomicrobiales bacterium]
MHSVEYVRRRQAAEHLRAKFGVGSPATLAKLATLGGGPIYQKLGRIPVYRFEDLDRWAVAKIGPAQKSSSEMASQSLLNEGTASR